VHGDRDWPHTPTKEQQTRNAIPVAYRPLRYEDVVDGFLGALPSPALAEPIMAANPGRLYGFPDAALTERPRTGAEGGGTWPLPQRSAPHRVRAN
jgi:hypothetical protein